MTEERSRPAYTRFHWAKAEPRDGYPKRIHLLEHHLADVGACFEALIRQPTIGKRLATAGGLADLDESLVARLSVFAALHDIGKANVGFQTRVWRDNDLLGRRRPSRSGHTLDLTPVLTRKDETTAEWFFDALGWWYDATESWDDCGGETVCGMLVATLSHHGVPLNLSDTRQSNTQIWQDFDDLSPRQFVEDMGKRLRDWFPAAFEPGGSALPSEPAFQHMFLGLCNWADWVGSDEDWFPFVDLPDDDYIKTARERAKQAIDGIGLNLCAQRDDFEGVPGFGELFPKIDKPPNAIQHKAALDTPLDQPLVIIESETGSGKTEAALWRFARMYERKLVDGLYFALPTRSTAKQIHGRVESFIANLFPHDRPPVVLAVPGYEPDEDASKVAMHEYDNEAAGHREEGRSWASENPKRYLAAQVAVGTVDQAMMGALKVKNAHMRAACLARNLLVVDEVHASDTYMSVVLEALLDAHVGAGGYALLMSATLGSAARRRWLHRGRRGDHNDSDIAEEECRPYPTVSTSAGMSDAGENDQKKTVSMEATPTMRDFTNIAQRALAAARADANVLVVRNTVGYAVSTQQALEEIAGHDDKGLLFDLMGKTTLHHGRFAACDRAMLDKRIEELLGKGRQAGGRVVVGTQTLEQSLDIDADLLITDLCPVDVLLQRIGRLHRHSGNDRPGGYDSPSCVILTPEGGDLSPLLESGRDANGLGPKGYVYSNLAILEATLGLIGEHDEWRIPKMNRKLVERATHSKALEAINEKMGEKWEEHGIEVIGLMYADVDMGKRNAIRRDKAFYPKRENRRVRFGSDEEKIHTRLGADMVRIKFEAQPPSPFDPARTIQDVSVLLGWLGEESVPDSVEPSLADGGFTFHIGKRRFQYDRFGLRRL